MQKRGKPTSEEKQTNKHFNIYKCCEHSGMHLRRAFKSRLNTTRAIRDQSLRI